MNQNNVIADSSFIISAKIFEDGTSFIAVNEIKGSNTSLIQYACDNRELVEALSKLTGKDFNCNNLGIKLPKNSNEQLGGHLTKCKVGGFEK